MNICSKYERSIYKKASRLCKKKGIPFAHSGESFDRSIHKGHAVRYIVWDCSYWYQAYREDSENW